MTKQKEPLKEYIVRAQVRAAYGYQEFIVRAISADAAIEAFRNGEGDFEDEQISVDEFGSITAEVNE